MFHLIFVILALVVLLALLAHAAIRENMADCAAAPRAKTRSAAAVRLVGPTR